MGKRQVHETLKWAGITTLVDEELKGREEDRDQLLAQLDSSLLRNIMRRYYDRRPAGQVIESVRDLRLKTAAYFVVMCRFGNIDDFGVERAEVMTALLSPDQDAMTEALHKTSLPDHMDEVVGFARQLDRIFNP